MRENFYQRNLLNSRRVDHRQRLNEISELAALSPGFLTLERLWRHRPVVNELIINTDIDENRDFELMKTFGNTAEIFPEGMVLPHKFPQLRSTVVPFIRRAFEDNNNPIINEFDQRIRTLIEFARENQSEMIEKTAFFTELQQLKVFLRSFGLELEERFLDVEAEFRAIMVNTQSLINDCAKDILRTGIMAREEQMICAFSTNMAEEAWEIPLYPKRIHDRFTPIFADIRTYLEKRTIPFEKLQEKPSTYAVAKERLALLITLEELTKQFLTLYTADFSIPHYKEVEPQVLRVLKNGILTALAEFSRHSHIHPLTIENTGEVLSAEFIEAVSFSYHPKGTMYLDVVPMLFSDQNGNDLTIVDETQCKVDRLDLLIGSLNVLLRKLPKTSAAQLKEYKRIEYLAASLEKLLFLVTDSEFSRLRNMEASPHQSIREEEAYTDAARTLHDLGDFSQILGRDEDFPGRDLWNTFFRKPEWLLQIITWSLIQSGTDEYHRRFQGSPAGALPAERIIQRGKKRLKEQLRQQS